MNIIFKLSDVRNVPDGKTKVGEGLSSSACCDVAESGDTAWMWISKR